MKNLVIVTFIIAAVGFGGYLMSQKNQTAESMVTDETGDMPMNTPMNSSSGSVEEMDLTGIHIMADGSVMLGDGTIVADAIVNSDGMIVLPDGSVVEPLMDMR